MLQEVDSAFLIRGTGRTRGLDGPQPMGMRNASSSPDCEKRCSILRTFSAHCLAGRFPVTVVMACMRKTSGRESAKRRAMASSMPGSQSMIMFFIFVLLAVVLVAVLIGLLVLGMSIL